MVKVNGAPIYPISGTVTASAKFQKVRKPEDCDCVITPHKHIRPITL